MSPHGHVRGAFARRERGHDDPVELGTQYATQGSREPSVPVILADAVPGADIVLVGMSIKTGSRRSTRNVEIAPAPPRSAGVPLVGEVYPAGHEDISPEERHEQIAIGCRIVAELGVDLVKTFHTGERFGEIVASTPVPVLGLGSRKLPREQDALELAAEIVAAGARGVVFGRNLIQARDPRRFLEALCDVVRDGVPAAEAAARHGLA
jgi:DhnA family fructose-bisphosphate aldolase class Ia